MKIQEKSLFLYFFGFNESNSKALNSIPYISFSTSVCIKSRENYGFFSIK